MPDFTVCHCKIFSEFVSLYSNKLEFEDGVGKYMSKAKNASRKCDV